ncbi:MAG TPA: hypothetical protein VNU01_00165, partial [Egibacteraceae bacterium]|nr:hypothetical protein [Egibacteraceae bacterium]
MPQPPGQEPSGDDGFGPALRGGPGTPAPPPAPAGDDVGPVARGQAGDDFGPVLRGKAERGRARTAPGRPPRPRRAGTRRLVLAALLLPLLLA